jgi:Caspase domain
VKKRHVEAVFVAAKDSDAKGPFMNLFQSRIPSVVPVTVELGNGKKRKDKVLSALQKAVQNCKDKQDSLVVIAYQGHGFLDENDGRALKLGYEENTEILSSTELNEILSQFGAQTEIVFLFDCCFPMRPTRNGTVKLERTLPANEDENKAVQAEDDFVNGFTRYLLRPESESLRTQKSQNDAASGGLIDSAAIRTRPSLVVIAATTRDGSVTLVPGESWLCSFCKVAIAETTKTYVDLVDSNGGSLSSDCVLSSPTDACDRIAFESKTECE